MTAVFLALRWILASIWLMAGATKLGAVDSFSTSLEAYGVLPHGVVGPVARVLPVAEVVLGIALALGFLPEIGGWVSMAAFVSFAGVVSWNLARGRQFDCGCGIGVEALISWRLVVRNVLLAGVAMAVARGPSGGLAIFRGGALLPSGAPGYRTLIAVPMIVILLAVMTRLLVSGGLVQLFSLASSTRAKRMSGTNSLAVVQVDGRDATPSEAR